MSDLKEGTVRNYAILILMVIATYLNDFKIAAYCLIAGGIIGLIYKFGYEIITNITKK